MELIIVVRTNNFSLQLRRTVENPTVQSQHVLGGNTVLLGLEPVQVRQHKARGVTNPSVQMAIPLRISAETPLPAAKSVAATPYRPTAAPMHVLTFCGRTTVPPRLGISPSLASPLKP